VASKELKKKKKRRKKRKELIRSITLFLLLVTFNKIIGLGCLGLAVFLIGLLLGVLRVPFSGFLENLTASLGAFCTSIQTFFASLTLDPSKLCVIIFAISMIALLILILSDLDWFLPEWLCLLLAFFFFALFLISGFLAIKFLPSGSILKVFIFLITSLFLFAAVHSLFSIL